MSSGRLGPPSRAPSCRRRRNDASPPGPDSRSTALPMTACSSAAQAASRRAVPLPRRSSSTHSRTRSCSASTFTSPVTIGAIAASQAMASAASPSSQAPPSLPVSEANARRAAHRSRTCAVHCSCNAESASSSSRSASEMCAHAFTGCPARSGSRLAGHQPPHRLGQRVVVPLVPGPVIVFAGLGAQRVQHPPDDLRALRGQVPVDDPGTAERGGQLHAAVVEVPASGSSSGSSDRARSYICAASAASSSSPSPEAAAASRNCRKSSRNGPGQLVRPQADQPAAPTRRPARRPARPGPAGGCRTVWPTRYARPQRPW